MEEAPRRRSAFAAVVAEVEASESSGEGRQILMPGHTEAFNPFDKSAWTAERREAQRQRVKQLIAEGKMGGNRMKRAKKAQEIVAEHAQAQADVIIARLDGMLSQRKDQRLQLEAIREFFRAEEWATKNLREEEKFYRDMNEDELNQALIQMIGDALGFDVSELIVDGTFVDETEQLLLESCAGCREERDSLETVMREAGVEDEVVIRAATSQAFCEKHKRASGDDEEELEDSDGDD